MRLITRAQEREIEKRGILTLASRFRGKSGSTLTGPEMALKVQAEADKLIKRLEDKDE